MPRYGRESSLDSKVYVGDLPRDASEKELERAFSYYGPLKKNVWVARNPPGFAFVEFDDPRDADDAIRGLDGTNLCGSRIRVELSSGKTRPKPWMRSNRGPPRLRRAFDSNDRCYECGERGHYAYDCRRPGGRGGGGSGGGRSSRRRRSRSRSRSHSRENKRSYSRSRSWSRSRSRSKSRDRSPRSDKGSPARNNDD